jgi:hypothetical protein
MGRYLIFARRRYEDSLRLEGELEAGASEAGEAALAQLADGEWVEVQLVPEAEIRWIVRPAGGQRRDREGAVSGV